MFLHSGFAVSIVSKGNGGITGWKMKCQAQKLVTMLSSSFKGLILPLEPEARQGLIESHSSILGHLISDMPVFLQREVPANMSPSWSKMPEQKDNVLTGRGTLGYTVSLWAALSSQGGGKSLKATSAALNTVFCFWREKVIVPEVLPVHHVLTVLATHCLPSHFRGQVLQITCCAQVIWRTHASTSLFSLLTYPGTHLLWVCGLLCSASLSLLTSNLEKNDQTYYPHSVTNAVDPGQSAVLPVSVKVLSRESRIWTLKGDCVHKPTERNMMFTHQTKIKEFAQNQRFWKGKAPFSSLTGDALSRPLLASCICLIPQDSLREHCVWLSIAQQAPPAWLAPSEHTAPFGWAVSTYFQVWEITCVIKQTGAGVWVGKQPAQQVPPWCLCTELPAGGCVLPFTLQRSNKIIRFLALHPDQTEKEPTKESFVNVFCFSHRCTSTLS